VVMRFFPSESSPKPSSAALRLIFLAFAIFVSLKPASKPVKAQKAIKMMRRMFPELKCCRVYCARIGGVDSFAVRGEMDSASAQGQFHRQNIFSGNASRCLRLNQAAEPPGDYCLKLDNFAGLG